MPKASLESTILGLASSVSSLWFLKTLMLIISVELVFIKVDTSKILSILFLLIPIIISFFLRPAFSAGLSDTTSSILAGVKSLPTNIKIQEKIIIANKKLARGPPATINAR